MYKTIQSYVDVMLYCDIIERHEIGKVQLVKDTMKRLIAGNAKSFSVHKYYAEILFTGNSEVFRMSVDSCRHPEKKMN